MIEQRKQHVGNAGGAPVDFIQQNDRTFSADRTDKERFKPFGTVVIANALTSEPVTRFPDIGNAELEERPTCAGCELPCEGRFAAPRWASHQGLGPVAQPGACVQGIEDALEIVIDDQRGIAGGNQRLGPGGCRGFLFVIVFVMVVVVFNHCRGRLPAGADGRKAEFTPEQ